MDPGLPVTKPLSSPWLQNNPFIDPSQYPPLTYHTMADILVIGMGISGASMAYHLAHSMPPGTRVILVDARGPAEGATGRNGGHLQPFVHRDFRRDVRDLGLEAALWIRRVEEEGVQEIRELGLGDPVEQGGIVHVWTSEDEKQDALLDLAAAQEAGIAQDLVVLSAQEVNEVRRLIWTKEGMGLFLEPAFLVYIHPP